MVQVMVWVVSLEECVHAYEDPGVQSPNAVIEIRAVPSLFVTVRFETFTDPSAIVPFTESWLNAMPWLVLVSVADAATVRFVAVKFDVRTRVPAIVSAANDWLAANAIVWFVPVNVTEEPADEKVVADDVSQEPAMEIEARPKVRTAGPVELRLPLKMIVVPVRVSVPDHVTFDEKVVLIPGITVRLKIGCVIRIDPPDALTTMVELAAAKAPAEVSIARTVMLLPPAVSAPPLPTVRFAPPVMLFPDVVRVPVISRFPPTSVALFCVTVPEIVRLWNPLEASRVRMVLTAPDMMIVLVPFVNVAPTPDVSQLPPTVQAPVVSVMVPDVPPLIVTFTADTVEPFAMRIS